jgi:hypothetical protein
MELSYVSTINRTYLENNSDLTMKVRGSFVSVVTAYEPDDRESIPGRVVGIFSLSPHSDCLLGPSTLLSN